MRIAALFDNFGPYHMARLNAAASIMDLTGIETVAQSREYAWQSNAEASFPGACLFPASAQADLTSSGISDRLTEELDKAQPDVVAIPGWSDRAAFCALTWCVRTGTPAVLMSESTAADERRVAWREQTKRRIVPLYSTALVGGSRHVDYLAELGMPKERIFTGYDAVDNEYFARRAKEVRSQKDELRSRYGLPENYFLASARFIPKKNLPALIRAYAEYRKAAEVTSQNRASGASDIDGPPRGSGERAGGERVKSDVCSDIRHPTSDIWSLVLLGDGPLRSDLRRLTSDLRLDAYVHLPGFKQYDELPVYYGLAKAFVHASTTEQWGLVVNEAMASGLPVIVSNRCGCVPELVQEGVNGFTFDPYNEQQITDNLSALSSMSAEQRAKFGQASSEIIGAYRVDLFAAGLKSAVELAISLPRKQAGVLDRALLRGLMWR